MRHVVLHSGLRPAACAAFLYRAISFGSKSAACATVIGAASAPSRSRKPFISALPRTLLSEALSVATMFAGVPAGANSAHQFSYVNPGKVSAIVGYPGMSGVGFALLT